MEQSELEKEVALMKKDVEDQKREIESLKKMVERHDNQYSDQRVINEQIIGKLDTIQNKVEEMSVKVEKNSGRGMIDIMTIIVAIIVGFLGAGGSDMLKTIFK